MTHSQLYMPEVRFKEANLPGRRARPATGANDRWGTPKAIVERARELMGGIDLDPASEEIANEVVQATTYYTHAENGLIQPWYGRVFLNPPFSIKSGKAAFVRRMVEEWRASTIASGVLVLGALGIYSPWAEPAHKANCGMALLVQRHEVRFRDLSLQKQSAGYGITVFYFGHDQQRFARLFADLGQVYVPCGECG